MTYKQIQSAVLKDGRVVTVGETWLVKSGRQWTISAIVRGIYNVNVFILTAEKKGWSFAGECELVRKIEPHENLEIDDKVLVRDDPNDKWLHRHFAGIRSCGRAATFNNGATSYSAKNENNTTSWKYCIPYDPSITDVEK